jgi:hypothetical protein
VDPDPDSMTCVDPDPDSESKILWIRIRIEEKCWIQIRIGIRIESIRIYNPDLMVFFWSSLCILTGQRSVRKRYV